MLMDMGYFRVCCAVPHGSVADVDHNVDAVKRLSDQVMDNYADLAVFPELCITSYTCGDLFKQSALLDAAESGLDDIREYTTGSRTVLIVGMPVIARNCLYNCAVVLQGGEILGVVPKTYLPGHKEYYEPRWFTSAEDVPSTLDTVQVAGRSVPFGRNQVFGGVGKKGLWIGVEICEDLWAPSPPSTELATQGATVIANLSASNDLVGKSAYRQELVRQQSARCLCAYVYCSAGFGESSTDLVFGGETLIYENGKLLQHGEPFGTEEYVITADVDVELLRNERLNSVTYGQAAAYDGGDGRNGGGARYVNMADTSQGNMARDLRRYVPAHPFVPGVQAELDEHCREILHIQSQGLARRLAHTGISRAVIGLSGGLDSTLALLVTVQAFSKLGMDRRNICCFTLPGFGTTEGTQANVSDLCETLGLAYESVDICDVCDTQLLQLEHDGTQDTAYENVQARQRTQFLMNKANMLNALVVGTGDLSELALGWCTYNADHMSMYAVNAGVPKTLIRFVIRYLADNSFEKTAGDVLHRILETPVSPELVPPDREGAISQKTEDILGPYELHDFFLYWSVRMGFGPAKVLYLADQAFGEKYDLDNIYEVLKIFYKKFFSQQFKRSCLPDGPQVGTVALSPRGNWRMPSDADVSGYIRRLDEFYGGYANNRQRER